MGDFFNSQLNGLTGEHLLPATGPLAALNAADAKGAVGVVSEIERHICPDIRGYVPGGEMRNVNGRRDR